MNILFWSAFIFLAGELACALDVYVMQKMTFINEGIHDIAMLIAFSGFIWCIYKFTIQKVKCFKFVCPQYKTCEFNLEICDKAQEPEIYQIWLIF